MERRALIPRKDFGIRHNHPIQDWLLYLYSVTTDRIRIRGFGAIGNRQATVVITRYSNNVVVLTL